LRFASVPATRSRKDFHLLTTAHTGIPQENARPSSENRAPSMEPAGVEPVAASQARPDLSHYRQAAYLSPPAATVTRTVTPLQPWRIRPWPCPAWPNCRRHGHRHTPSLDLGLAAPSGSPRRSPRRAQRPRRRLPPPPAHHHTPLPHRPAPPRDLPGPGRRGRPMGRGLPCDAASWPTAWHESGATTAPPSAS
jgi:hypothetical protein